MGNTYILNLCLFLLPKESEVLLPTATHRQFQRQWFGEKRKEVFYSQAALSGTTAGSCLRAHPSGNPSGKAEPRAPSLTQNTFLLDLQVAAESCSTHLCFSPRQHQASGSLLPRAAVYLAATPKPWPLVCVVGPRESIFLFPQFT